LADFDRESMLEMFIFEMTQLTEQLETTIVQSEEEYNTEQINEIFRIMHTIKGSSAMMMYDNIASVSHAIEDLFYFLREESPKNIDFHTLSDHVLEGADFVKAELAKIQSGESSDGDGTELIQLIEEFLTELKIQAGKPVKAKLGAASAPAQAAAPPKPEAAQPEPEPVAAKKSNKVGGLYHYKAKIFFEDGCEMENIRAYTLVHNLGGMAQDVNHIPEDVIEDEAIEFIRKNGFTLTFASDYGYKNVHDHLIATVYLKDLTLEEVAEEDIHVTEETSGQATPAETQTVVETIAAAPITQPAQPAAPAHPEDSGVKKQQAAQTMISVNVNKLDALLNQMGELVIAEAMVTQNSELEGLQLDSFYKETRQLRKNIENMRDIIMSMRMVPLSSTFFKMHRIVRDMCRQLDKDVQLDIVGEDTEVDKNINEHISDPIMHIIRNSIDHGIEMPAERRKAGKPEKGTVLLEAKSAGGDVLIIIKDDGAGIDTAKVMRKAKENALLRKPESEYTDKEIQQFIFMPGFSTNDAVTTYSGRGVGMDVVTANLEIVGGTVLVDSVPGEGSTFTLKIPLTLAIIDGMSVLVAGAQYTIPIVHIIKSFKAQTANLFTDPNGNEMITERGEIYNIVRLHEFFGIDDAITTIEDGTLIMLESGEQVICLLVDDLIGQQQAVVKSMPKYFRRVKGLSGCTLLGNGNISLIVDVAGFFDK
jgi:two-component system chemotaxis sensor kinase CheA